MSGLGADENGSDDEEGIMDIKVIPIDKPEDMNVIIGQSHFIKTVEDLHEAIVTTGAGT